MPKTTKLPWSLLAVLSGVACIVVGCTQPADTPEPGITAPTLSPTDIHGRLLAWPPPDDAGPTVLLFVSRACPIANGYAPEIGRLHADYAPRGVRLWLVHPEPTITAGQARDHAEDYALPGTVVPDPGQRLTDAIGATVTPEAVLVLPGGEVAYRGRIDDRYADLGVRRPAVRSTDLRDALDAVLAGEPVPTPRTEPVGCLIEAPLPESTE